MRLTPKRNGIENLEDIHTLIHHPSSTMISSYDIIVVGLCGNTTTKQGKMESKIEHNKNMVPPLQQTNHYSIRLPLRIVLIASTTTGCETNLSAISNLALELDLGKLIASAHCVYTIPPPASLPKFPVPDT